MRQIGVSTTGNPIVELTNDEMLKFSAFAKSPPEWFSVVEERLQQLREEQTEFEQEARKAAGRDDMKRSNAYWTMYLSEQRLIDTLEYVMDQCPDE